MSYEDLAVPFAENIVKHLELADKQGTSGSSRFLDACRKFKRSEISIETLQTITTKLGFVNVIGAFHKVNNIDLPISFYSEREDKRGLVLSDELFQLGGLPQFLNLPEEIESRWRLVETAWSLEISRNLILVEYDKEEKMLFSEDKTRRRVSITSSRAALNGYQKGKCFYCFADLCIDERHFVDVEVDHFIPFTLGEHGVTNLNGVWNLVLSCKNCNRGAGEKFKRIPKLHLLDRLHRRNEFLIGSHHPLRETLMQQTGTAESSRVAYLNAVYSKATSLIIHKWEPSNASQPCF